MEEYEEQEQEFWRRLAETDMSRSTMLRRSVAAAAGLTVLSTPAVAAAGRRVGVKTPPLKGKSISMKELVAEAKKEGKVNVIALPHDWANYGESISTFKKKYGLAMDETNPGGTSAQENEAIRSLKGDSRAPDAVDVTVSLAVDATREGLYGKYFVSTFSTIPRAMKDTRGFWWGDYWGAVSIGYNQNLISNPPTSFKDLLKPEYKGKVALNGSPLQSGSAIAGVFAAALANGGSAKDVGPGIDWWAQLKKVGNYIPIQTTPHTVASGQTPISIDWDYNNLAYERVPGGSVEGQHPVRRRLRRLLRAGDQCNRAAPVVGEALGGVPLLRPGADPVAEGLRASGALQRPGEAQEDPEGPADGTAAGGPLRKGEVRERRAADCGEELNRCAVAV
jgi:hypothetical protein